MDHSGAAQSTPAGAVGAALHDDKIHLLLAASGSVATIKLPLIISSLSRHPNLSIRVILSKTAARFLAGQSDEQPPVSSLSALPNVDGVYMDEDDWVEPWTRNAPILHINLRRWAHLLVIAPLSANTLAKVVNGMADNLLTSVVRAWDTTGFIDGGETQPQPNQDQSQGPGRGIVPKRIVVAPAMNTAMYAHPVTAQQIRVLEEEWGIGAKTERVVGDDMVTRGCFEVLHPTATKTLACGDIGSGAMREWTEIVTIIEERLGLAG